MTGINPTPEPSPKSTKERIAELLRTLHDTEHTAANEPTLAKAREELKSLQSQQTAPTGSTPSTQSGRLVGPNELGGISEGTLNMAHNTPGNRFGK